MLYFEILAKQIGINMNGMIVLIAWAVINIILGVFLMLRYKKKDMLRYFFQMNALWNVVALLIGIGTMFMLSNIMPEDMDLTKVIFQGFMFEKILLVNAGLDIAYVAIGNYLVEHGLRVNKVAFEGYGKALWLQGAFLFLFDITLFLINFYYNQQYSTFILF